MRRPRVRSWLGPLLSTAAMLAGCGDKAPPQPPYAAPRPLTDPSRGLHIQRTMRALAESTLREPRTVRVLFYGQSITVEPWTRVLAERLRERYPAADLVVENKAIGGFVADLLVRTARADVLTFNPDLIVMHDLFHVPAHLDALIAELMSLSTAEIIVQTTHRRGEGLKRTRWDDLSVAEYARVCRQNELQLVDVRASWKSYLKDQGLHPMALLRDEAGHLNPAGNALMAALLERELVFLPDVPADPKGVGVPTHVVFDDSGNATLQVEAARVEVDVSAGTGGAPVRVRVDGVAPSTFADAWVHGRVGTALCTDWPWDCAAPIKVGHRTAPVDEEWTMTLRSVARDGSTFTFDLVGSVTGPDGSGSSARDFVSNSGRVTIEARDWWLAQAHEHHKRPYPDTIVMKWRPIALHADELRAGPKPARKVLFAGLENRRHTITLERAGDGVLPFLTVTTFKPRR